MSNFRHTYNTTTSGTGPAGLQDYNGEGADASVSKKVYVEHASLDTGNTIEVSRDGSGSDFKVLIKADYNDWKKDSIDDVIPLVSNTVLNALADARVNSPLVVPTYIYDAVLQSYSLTTVNEHHWECELVFEPFKPDDPNSNSNSEDNPDNNFTQDPTVTYKGSSRVQMLASQTAFSVRKSVGYFDVDAFRNDRTFKSINNGSVANVTQSIPKGIADFSVQKTYPVGTITQQFKRTVQEMTGSFNKHTFDGHKQGSVMFAGVDYSFDATNKEIVTYKFQFMQDVEVSYVRYNHEFFMEKDYPKALKKSNFKEILENPQNVRTEENNVPLLGNKNELIVARGWDIIQFAYERIGVDEIGTNKRRIGAMSVTTGHQVLISGPQEDFDVLGLGL